MTYEEQQAYNNGQQDNQNFWFRIVLLAGALWVFFEMMARGCESVGL